MKKEYKLVIAENATTTKPKNFIFEISHADWEKEEKEKYILMSTLEELKEFQKSKGGYALLIDFDSVMCGNQIEIIDYDRE